jgi:hypothetical protein
MLRPARLFVFAAITAAAALFQAWFLGVGPSSIVHRQSRHDLVDAYVESLASGRPYVLPQPVAAVRQSMPVGWIRTTLDSSYFDGKYYIYYGIAPFALVFVPWYKLTGTFLSAETLILGALLAGYAAYGFTLWFLFRKDARSAINWLLPLGFVAVIAAGETWTSMDQPYIHEVESASGYAALGGAIACLAVAWTSDRRRALPLGLATALAGLAMGCRPNCFPEVLLVASIAAWLAWKYGGAASRRAWYLSAALVPLAGAGLSLAGWNFLRFGNPFEFGMHYGTGAVSSPSIVKFSYENIPYNIHRYLLGGIRWGHYFPFIDGVKPGPISLPIAIHEPVDQLYGCLVLSPVLVFACLLAPRRRGVLVLLAAAAASNLLVLSGLGFGSFRYPSDYLGALAFAAALGIASIADIRSKFARMGVVLALIITLGWSCFMSLFAAVSIARMHELFDQERPAAFSAMARPFNAVAYRLARLAHSGPRSIRVSLILPGDRFGRVEPLMVDGDPGLEDFVYFYYAGPGLLQIGFESMGRGGPLSHPLAVDYSRRHLVDVSLGSLLPPDDHPLLRSMSRGDVAIARRLVHIELDQRTVLEGFVDLHPPRERFFFGASPDDQAFGATFTGKSLTVARPLISARDVLPKWTADQFGPLAVESTIGSPPPGLVQPLVSLGYHPSGALLGIKPVAPGLVQLVWLGQNSPELSSPPIAWVAGKSHLLTLRAGGLLPPLQSSLWGSTTHAMPAQEAKEMVSCLIDGRVVWKLTVQPQDASPSSICVGSNAIQATGTADQFSGHLVELGRKSW